MHWSSGDADVKVTEEGGLRYFRTTAVLSGVKLDLFVQSELYDRRLVVASAELRGCPSERDLDISS
jgi:hypothetical protein